MDSSNNIGFHDILHDELDSIAKRRNETSWPRSASPNVYDRAAKFGLFGLSFSGGGIRSATFNLGVLQALQELNLLSKVDYLSTVSGGGYIGSWFISWVKRLGGIPPLAGKTSNEGEYKEPNPIRHLRRYSNYLTPKVGLMNADTWSIASMYVRNLLLNLLVLIPLLIGALLVPHLLLSLLPLLNVFSTTSLFAFGYLLLVCACFCVGLNLVWKKKEFAFTRTSREPAEQALAQRKNDVRIPRSFVTALACTLTASAIAAYVLHRVTRDAAWHLPFAQEGSLVSWVFYGLILYVLLWILALIPFGLTQMFRKIPDQTETGLSPSQPEASGKVLRKTVEKMATAFSGWSYVILGGVLAGPVCGLLFYLLLQEIIPLLSTAYISVVLGMPIVLAVLAIVVTLQIGIAGTNLPDFAREWWSRFGGWVIICSVMWIAATSVAFYSYALVNKIPDWFGGANLTAAWIATTASGLFAAKSDRTGGAGANKLLELFVKITPALFAIGIITLTSYYVHDLLTHNESIVLGGIIACCVAVSVFFAWRVNVNVFSLNSMYYNRLTRCYLGASRDRTNVNPIIGFDEQDDEFGTYSFVKDAANNYSGPYPIINTAVNLVKGKELSWQKRKASSFFFTPLHCGFRSGVKDCYGRAGEYPTLLGHAVSISGAAASPNMGYHTSVPLAFLMTIFNVRLGSWFPNPAVTKKRAGEERVSTDGPPFGLFYLLKELFGLTDESSRYVYLSDGGHFENLGLYELVRRRCKYIIVCDAAADPYAAFGDLGNAIEKCRADFGVEIDLNVNALRRDTTLGMSQAHWVRGTIRYPASENVSEGTRENGHFVGDILYIKSTLTGDEPTDVLSYRQTHKEFPHESTADQWFDESQFESYRKLGYHIVRGLSNVALRSPESLMNALKRPAPRRGVPLKTKQGAHSRSVALSSTT
jgi:hypothetical protein